MKSYGVTVQLKPLQQYFHMILVLSVVPTFESVYEILWYDHSNETSSAVRSHETICLLVFYRKKKWKFFLVLFLSWSLLKSGRVSLRVQHISKLKKNAIKWLGYFTLCFSPRTDLKMNSCWVHLLKF